MELDAEVCYRALRTRDARFDGRFFTAVRSTGIYCRPVCPAPTPKLANCLFVPCAAAAQEAGFRPCLRCRPETSPGTPAWLGTSATVSRALRLISQGALDAGGSVETLANRLGIGERQLRRLFLEHLGAAPVAVAQTRRVLFSKKLIDETSLPMTEIAFAAGFASVRRFNDAIRKIYDMPPGALRRKHRAASKSARRGASQRGELQLVLAFREPFDWDALLAFLALRATRGIEVIENGRYRRSFDLEGIHGIVDVERPAGASHLAVRIRLAAPVLLIQVAERLRRIFDLGADPEQIEAHLKRDRRLRPAFKAHPGLRVPGAWDGFELAVRAILGQQVSVRAASTMAGRIVSTWGAPLEVEDTPSGAEGVESALTHVFPTPEVLAAADLSSIGLIRSRALAISGLAAAVVADPLLLEPGVALEDGVAKLTALAGVGEWTAQYIAMRALGEPDAFPCGDLGLRKALAAEGAGPVADRVLRSAAEDWRPWRAYAAMALWCLPSSSPLSPSSRQPSTPPRQAPPTPRPRVPRARSARRASAFQRTPGFE